MNILLDTHTLIWFLEGSPEMSTNARNIIEDLDNIRFVSSASIWEIAVKVSIEKLELKYPFKKINSLLWENSIDLLPIRFEHTLELTTLPFHHKDPFDRIIIAQAIVEQMPIISKDGNFKYYNINQIW